MTPSAYADFVLHFVHYQLTSALVQGTNSKYGMEFMSRKGINEISSAIKYGVMAVALVLILGVTSVMTLGNFNASGVGKELGVIFASTIAATGVVLAAFIAYKTGQAIESEKDRNERKRRVDEARVEAEAAIVFLHVIASRLDNYYLMMEYEIDGLDELIKKKDLAGLVFAAQNIPSMSFSSYLLEKLDIRFMRLEEQKAVSRIELCLQILAAEVKDTRVAVGMGFDSSKKALEAMGDEKFFTAQSYYVSRLRQKNAELFDAINPYIFERKPITIPDEYKLRMLLGVFRDDDFLTFNSIHDARESARKLASGLLKSHFRAGDVRAVLIDVAESIRDEDSIPFGNNGAT